MSRHWQFSTKMLPSYGLRNCLVWRYALKVRSYQYKDALCFQQIKEFTGEERSLCLGLLGVTGINPPRLSLLLKQAVHLNKLLMKLTLPSHANLI